jgi:hypothetical protein
METQNVIYDKRRLKRSQFHDRGWMNEKDEMPGAGKRRILEFDRTCRYVQEKRDRKPDDSLRDCLLEWTRQLLIQT